MGGTLTDPKPVKEAKDTAGRDIPSSATGVCSSCGQWKHNGRCLNDCQKHGFDDKDFDTNGKPRQKRAHGVEDDDENHLKETVLTEAKLKCLECGKTFSRNVKAGDDPECPKCGGSDVELSEAKSFRVHVLGESVGPQSKFEVGDRVKYSGYALERDRQYYLGLGDYSRKNAAKEFYENKLAQRGTVTDVSHVNTTGLLSHSAGAEVKWDDTYASGQARMSQSMDHMLEKAK